MQQMTNERIAAQVQSLERSRSNRTVLLHDLAPFTNTRALDNNINHFLWGANLEESDVCALHNHLVTSMSAVVRGRVPQRAQGAAVFELYEKLQKYWGLRTILTPAPERQTTRCLCSHSNTLLDILGELEDEPDFQVWRETLQIWSSKKATDQRMLVQVAYVLDARYSRRYCCLLLLCEEHYTPILDRWHSAMNLIQALRRAVIDRTTTTRPTYDKAFDVSNVAFHPP